MKKISKSKVIRVDTREAKLKRQLRRHLAGLGFTRTTEGNLVAPGGGKQAVRDLHSAQRKEILGSQKAFIEENLPKFVQYFASGVEVIPDRIEPVLELVEGAGWRAKLFRLATMTWSVPVSAGFGRRLRFLIWDKSNNKLIGIMAIGDPVFNLGVRDQVIGWTGDDRRDRLVNIMDAYVLGALPPYNRLLCGKLITCLLRSREVYKIFQKKYGKEQGIISGKSKRARLLAITTTSSMGRSSIYNRLRLGGTSYFSSIGYSGGWGHFHVPDKLFTEMREFLREKGSKYADLHAYGDGPNWRIRTIRDALSRLGFKGDLLKHGVKREVFISFLADNASEILCGKRVAANFENLLTVKEISKLALDRWVIPRAKNQKEYLDWNSCQIEELIFGKAVAQIPTLAKA